MITYGSVCSGIEAASLAWEPLGWRAEWFAEIEKFPSAVLAHRWPHVPNLGDMTVLPEWIRAGLVSAPDVLVGGTPCQAFSVAGMRKGLVDPRGALTIKFVEVADAIDSQRPDSPCVIVWENVPGVLSDKSNAFGCFLAALVGESGALEPPGGKWSNAGCVLGPQRAAAWRIVDAQYFGVAQRRRRVFVVASAREGFDPTEVLFEREGVRRDTAPSREAGETATGVAGTGAQNGDAAGSTFGFTKRGGFGYSIHAGGVVNTLDRGQNVPFCVTPPVCMAHGQSGAEIRSATCNHEAPIVAFNWNAQPDQMNFSSSSTPALTCSQGAAVCQYGDVAGSLTARHDSSPCADRGMNAVARAVSLRGREGGTTAELGGEIQNCMGTGGGGGNKPHVLFGLTVRRLTPRECERLQGMPDDHTAIPNAADGPRYKAIGNSKAVPVVQWLGRRLERVL